jgi:hypothetical protein
MPFPQMGGYGQLPGGFQAGEAGRPPGPPPAYGWVWGLGPPADQAMMGGPSVAAQQGSPAHAALQGLL